MAVKRTNNLSSTISRLDRRIKTVENGSVSLTPGLSALTTTAPADDENATSGGNFLGTNAPYQYKRVKKAYIYGPRVTGNTSRAELYFTENPEIVDAEYVQVQGIHGTSADEIDVSGIFKVYDVDTPPWDDGARANQPWRNEPSVDITHTVWYNPVVVPPSNYSTTSGRELITTRLIDSVTATGTTVTVNLNSNHRFFVGDVISVDLEDDLFGVDGLFKIATIVDSNTFTYELDSALGSPISLSGAGLGTKYVYPVAHRYVEDGTIWTDSSVEPNKIYIWKDYRWYDTSEPAVAESGGVDTVAPSPVGNLSATSAVQDIPTAEIAGKATITLTWDAPTTNENGTSITDLGGYSVWWRYSLTEEWRINEIDDPAITTWFGENFTYNVTVLLAVYAKDKFGNRSTATTTSILTSATPAESIGIPSAPSVTGYLGTMKVYWNGLNADNNAITPTSGVFEVILHVSKTNDFTPSSGTLFERFPAINGPTYTVIPGNAILDGGPVIDGQTYYFKFIFLDVWGNQTGASAQGSFVGKVSDIVTYDMLDVGTLVGQTIVGLDIRTNSNPSADGGLVLDQTGFTAYNSAGIQTFNISAATGAILIGSSAPATQADIGNFIEGSDVNNFVTSITNTTITTPTLTGGTIQTTSVANRGIKIQNSNLVAYNSSGFPTFTVDGSTGQVTIASGVSIGGYATTGDISDFIEASEVNNNVTSISGNVITTGTINASVVSVTNINANNISVGTLNVARIGSGTLPAGVIYAGTINADNINAGTLTGRSVQTATSGKRILISQASNSIVIYNDNGNITGRIQGATTSGGSTVVSGPGTAQIEIGSVTTVFDGSISTSGTSNIFAAGRLGQNTFASLGTTTAVGRDSVSQLFGPSGSDLRLKDNIQELSNSLDLINALRPVKFTYRSENNGPVSYGLIAQEVQPLFDEIDNVVNVMDPAEDGTQYLSLEYNAFIAPLIKAVQELSQKNDELQARIATLEGTT
jgi:hypothetical protein